MLNNVTNTVSIWGRLEDLKRIKRWIDGGEEQRVDFNKIKPMPKPIREVKTGYCTINGKEVRVWKEVNGKNVTINPHVLARWERKYGALDWYSWSCENWGTKWNAYGITVYPLKPDSRRLVLEFDTAWSPPRPIFKEIVRKFPGVSIDVAVSGEVDEPFSFRVEPEKAAV